ncbi:hypothetical protein F0919_02190 [Taibaiella lutea]|uniref:Polysaccharide chain length determinant N-terminal domain-containing protein n=1 Tax=Taibaiella lutea TaxID=2608001 RepID=A0A5M6CTK1_9BACT|nr:Wzz/FepE/Etk N-terminal domain-containing protein [Taibaiella lutea]KAA5536499.1 hypothetical protein F0919_02190 [Taibaiella lutea]
MNDQSFDLIGIFKQIFKKKVFVISITLAALIISIVFCSLQPKGYTSRSVFIVKNPLLIDRNFVFRNSNFENKEFFAIADDVDHVKTIAKSDAILWYLIDSFNLRKAYNMEDDGKIIEEVRGNFKAVMEDTKNIEIFYTDPDPERAAKVTNAARQFLETTFLNYFLLTNKDVTEALNDKAIAIRDSINVLDDSIQIARTAIGNYTQLLPTRGETINSGNNAINPSSASSLERLQELVIRKDKLANDVANYESLMNEYQVMANGKIRLFYVIQEARPNFGATHPKTLIIVGASTIAAFFFACVLVLLGGFYQFVMQHKKEKTE